MSLSAAVLSVLAAASIGVHAQFEESSYPYAVPAGLEKPPVPEDNPVTDAKAELGKILFFDKRLSRDSTVSCATCHDPAKGWTDQAPVSTGIRGQKGGRSAPTVLNSAYNELQFWDGRAASLEEQAKGPIENPIEMGFTHKEAVERLSKIKGYKPLFKRAFDDDAVTIDRIAQAIATFERTILTGNAPYDKYQTGEKDALSTAQKRGMGLFFGKANCSVCHAGHSFSDFAFHNIGVGMTAQKPDLGRAEISKDESHTGAFKTPVLRNLSYTFPYMHDGSHKTLEEVVDYYNKGGEPKKWLSRDMRALQLNADEATDLVAFLRALDGDPVVVLPPQEFPR